MKGQSARAPFAVGTGEQWDTLRTLIRGLEDERDLHGLAAIAEMGLMALRQMCERPVTCEELGEMLERLRQLKLDAFELGEDS